MELRLLGSLVNFSSQLHTGGQSRLPDVLESGGPINVGKDDEIYY